MAAAAPNGNGHHHRLLAGGQLNPAGQLQATSDRAFERSLRRRIRVLGDTIERLQRMFTLRQARNHLQAPAAALLRIIERINRAHGRRSTLYNQLYSHIRRRRRHQPEQQQQPPPPPPPPAGAGNGNGNGAAGPPPADGN